jgi:predicted ATPase
VAALAEGRLRARVRVLLSLDSDELPDAEASVCAALGDLRVDVRRDRQEGSDVFVGVYGDRYGGIDPTLGVSRLEQDYLAAGNRPRLVYVLPGEGARDAHLALLLSRIQADDLTSYRRVGSVEELASLVTDDLAMVLTEAFTGEMPAMTQSSTAPRGPSDGAGSTLARSPGAGARVPAPWHRLVGRDKELDDVCALLHEGTRLLTLTGPGGIGKSRLAIEVATLQQQRHADGVWFVDLAGIRDPALLAPTIAHALGIRESAGVSPVESLKTYLASMEMLLLLDSFETVTAASPVVIDLLSAAAGVQAFVTSRSLLRVRGEQEYAIGPLAVPMPGATSVEDGGGAALELFLERAMAANPTRPPDPRESQAAIEICRRLEGVPLSLELAAARTRVLPPTLLLGRLGRALDELMSGPLDLPERQRTLRTTIDWDYELLGLEEQIVFRRLAAFPRQFGLAAAEVVVAEPGLDVLDGLDGLAGKSLLRALEPSASPEPAFVMLQAVHDYALERLEASGEADEVLGRHARHVLTLVERAHGAPASDGWGWLAALEEAHPDIRAALAWADRSVDVDVLLRLAAGLGFFWRAHCHFSEGRRWLDRALSLSAGQRNQTRVDLLNAAGFLSRARGDFDTADAQYREALSIREQLGDQGKVSGSLRFLGNVAYDRGDLDGAASWWQRSLEALAGTEDEPRRMSVLNNLGVVAHHRGDEDTALRLYDETFALGEHLGSPEHRARAQMNKAQSLAFLGRLAEAEPTARSAVTIYAELDDTWDLVDALDVLAGCIGRSGATAEAGWLFGGASSLRTALDVRRPVSEQSDYDRGVAESRVHDPEAFDQAFNAGKDASLGEIVQRALGSVESTEAAG